MKPGPMGQKGEISSNGNSGLNSEFAIIHLRCLAQSKFKKEDLDKTRRSCGSGRC